jgi:hypothetical protein
MSVFPLEVMQSSLDLALETNDLDRYLLLLDNTNRSGTFTINTTTNVLTWASPSPMVTNCRVRLTSSGSQPQLAGDVPVSNATDYFVRRLTATTFTLHINQNDAILGSSELSFATTGSGTLTATEQPFKATDAMSAIVSRELTASYYQRKQLIDLPSAEIVGNRAERGPVFWMFELPAGAPTLTAGYLVIINGALSVVGNDNGFVKMVKPLSPAFTVLAGETKALDVLLTGVS